MKERGFRNRLSWHRGRRSGGLLLRTEVSGWGQRWDWERLTACSSRMLWCKFGHVVDGIVNDYPKVIGNIVFGDFLYGYNSCHCWESCRDGF